MEEILASIRRIIADDQALPLTPRPQAANLRAVVTEPVASEPPRPARPHPAAGSADLSRLGTGAKATTAPMEFAMTAPAPAANLGKADAWPGAKEKTNVRPMPSPAEISAARRSQEIADAIERELNASAVQPAPPAPAAVSKPATLPDTSAAFDRKLLSPAADASVAMSFSALATTMFLQNSGNMEQSVREMLRPMLQRWLDDNLPVMVEQLVRAEIERVARGGRG